MKPGLALRVSQHLSLTPQLQQSIRLLQLSTLEMAQEVQQMLDDNPFLERDTPGDDLPSPGPLNTPVSPPSTSDRSDAPDTPEFPETSSSTEAETSTPDDWGGDGSMDPDDSSSDWGGDAPTRSASGQADTDEADATELAQQQESLTEHLHRQALALRLGENDRAALYFLIESLNDDGYLEDSLEALVASVQGRSAEAATPDPDEAEQLLHHFHVALGLLQSLEPVGVGARGLAECLTLQLRALPAPSHTTAPDVRVLAQALCQQPLELLARRDVRRLMQACNASEEHIRTALALIARLEPRPARRFANVQRQIIVPDVIVKKTLQGLAVQLNPEVMPRLRVHEVYANALRGQRSSEGHAGLQARLQEARWFIKNIQQRFDTILRVSQAIVQRQKSFFVHGELAMRPLVLREIAEELGLHESTISRVTTAKYMATPQGTYELKYFFGSGLETQAGGSASSTAVRALIRQFVAAENPAKPLSDSKIADMLQEQGIECARRTVAKYREALKIAPASLRKTL